MGKRGSPKIYDDYSFMWFMPLSIRLCTVVAQSLLLGLPIDLYFCDRFLQGLTDCLVYLLNEGGCYYPDILEQVRPSGLVFVSFFSYATWLVHVTFWLQVFTSWQYIMMYLQKYLVKDVVGVLKWACVYFYILNVKHCGQIIKLELILLSYAYTCIHSF